MDRLFDRLGKLLLSLRDGAAARNPVVDPFLREAERELEDFLRIGGAADRGPGPADKGRAGPGGAGPQPLPDALRRDYANLGLRPSASLEQVRRAHRQLLSRYHPDRFTLDPEKQALATRITQLLNASFIRIQSFRTAAD